MKDGIIYWNVDPVIYWITDTFPLKYYGNATKGKI